MLIESQDRAEEGGVTVVAAGDPFDRRTWSGTPLALIEGLRAVGVKVTGMTPVRARPRLDPLVATLVNGARYGRSGRIFRDYFGMRVASHRRAMSRFMLRQGQSVASYLHTDYVWLPASGPMSARHFLFRDTSLGALMAAKNVPASLLRRIQSTFLEVPEFVNAVFATSEWARLELIRDGYDSEKVFVVGTGIGAAFASTAPKTPAAYESGRTLMVCKVRPHDKGLDLLLNAHDAARRKCPRLHLDIVAPQGLLRSRPGVTVHSNLKLSSLIDLYRHAALYAMPARYEPWGLVYLESLATATPILGARRCAFPELSLGGMAGIIVDDLEVEAVSDALLSAHGDPGKLASMGLVGQNHVRRNVSWEATARRISRVAAFGA